ncbi:MAG: HDOD domain-containing protein [candidate division Zixibacteria bacterium]|nr:HDOD domain-containing protein [candidate division Zixibacteria bacterium]
MNTNQESSEKVSQILGALGDLPASPAVVSLVMGMTSDLNTDVSKLSQGLSADQSLTARVLKLSNSPLYGRARGVASIEEAILVLGFFTLRSVVIATATHAMFKGAGKDSLAQSLWEHSLATAIASRLIARKLGHSYVEESYLAGLLHDIGKLILTQKFPEEYTRLVSRHKGEDIELYDLEQDQFGFSHTDLGEALLVKWEFPQDLIYAVARHHDLEIEAEANSAASIPLIVNLANGVAKCIGAGFKSLSAEDVTEFESLKALKLPDEDLAAIIEDLAENFQEERNRFL